MSLLSLASEKVQTHILPSLKEEPECSTFQYNIELAFKIGLLSDHQRKCYQLTWLICETHARNLDVPFSLEDEPVISLCLLMHLNGSAYKEWYGNHGRAMFLLGTMQLLYSRFQG